LHQPYNLAAIDVVSQHLAGVPQVACFDTGFHRGQPAVAEVVPLPARSAARRAALRLSRAVVRVHRLGAAAGGARKSPAGA
jgi:acetate kinase